MSRSSCILEITTYSMCGSFLWIVLCVSQHYYCWCRLMVCCCCCYCYCCFMFQSSLECLTGPMQTVYCILANRGVFYPKAHTVCCILANRSVFYPKATCPFLHGNQYCIKEHYVGLPLYPWHCQFYTALLNISCENYIKLLAVIGQ